MAFLSNENPEIFFLKVVREIFCELRTANFELVL